jgi:hypothetical protein
VAQHETTEQKPKQRGTGGDERHPRDRVMIHPAPAMEDHPIFAGGQLGEGIVSSPEPDASS